MKKLVIGIDEDLLGDIAGLLVKKKLVASVQEFEMNLKQGKIAVNGEVTEDSGQLLSNGDIVAIEGCGEVGIIK